MTKEAELADVLKKVLTEALKNLGPERTVSLIRRILGETDILPAFMGNMSKPGSDGGRSTAE